MERAGFKLRLGAGTIDLLLVFFLVCFVSIVSRGGGHIQVNDALDPIPETISATGFIIWNLVILALSLFELIGAASPGKIYLHMRIIGQDGASATRAVLLLRWLFKYSFALVGLGVALQTGMPGNAFSQLLTVIVVLGFFLSTSARGLALHDILSRSCVVWDR